MSIDYDKILEDFKKQSNFQQQANINCRRPLTPVQKEAMKPDFDTFKYLREMFAVFLVDLGVIIRFNPNMTPILELYQDKTRTSVAPYTLVGIEEHLNDLPNYYSSRIRAILDEITFFMWDGIQFRITNNVPQAQVITHDHGSIDCANGFPLDTLRHDNIGAMIVTYLYISDIMMILSYKSGRGNAIPRFLPFYPTKEINQILFARFAKEIKLCRLMTLDGLEIHKMTRQEIADYAKRLKV